MRHEPSTVSPVALSPTSSFIDVMNHQQADLHTMAEGWKIIWCEARKWTASLQLVRHANVNLKKAFSLYAHPYLVCYLKTIYVDGTKRAMRCTWHSSSHVPYEHHIPRGTFNDLTPHKDRGYFHTALLVETERH